MMELICSNLLFFYFLMDIIIMKTEVRCSYLDKIEMMLNTHIFKKRLYHPILIL